MVCSTGEYVHPKECILLNQSRKGVCPPQFSSLLDMQASTWKAELRYKNLYNHLRTHASKEKQHVNNINVAKLPYR